MKTINILFIYLITLSINVFAVNTFQYKKILPRSQWSDYTPDRPHTAVLMSDDGNIIVASQAFSSECIVMQKIDPYGNPLWADPETGLKLVDNTSSIDVNYYPSMASDGNGGVYIVYAAGIYAIEGNDWRFYFDTYLQHLDADGNKQWNDKGLLLKTGSYPWDIASDGEGGVYVLYYGSSNCDHYPGTLLQHINKAGEKKYPGFGFAIMECDSLYLNRLYLDGNHGIYISNKNNYLQRMNEEGEFLFPMPYIDTGLPNLLFQWFFNKGEEMILAGKEKGTNNLYVQKLSVDGEYLGNPNGYTYTWPDSLIFFPVIIQKNDSTLSVFNGYYAQNIQIKPVFQFKNPIRIMEKQINYPRVLYSVYTKLYGTFILFGDVKYEDGKNHSLVKMQKIDKTGGLPLGIEGITICDTTSMLSILNPLFTINEQTGTALVFLEFQDGLHVAIVDLKTGTVVDDKDEQINSKIPDNFIISGYPNPFHEVIHFTIKKPNLSDRIQTIKIYNILGKEVKDLTQKEISTHTFSWDGTDDSGQRAAAGIYFVQITAKQTFTQKILKLK